MKPPNMKQLLINAANFTFICTLLTVNCAFGEGNQARRTELKIFNTKVSVLDDSIAKLTVLYNEESKNISKAIEEKKVVDSSNIKHLKSKIGEVSIKKRELETNREEIFDVKQDFLSVSVLLFGLILIFMILVVQGRKGLGLTYLTFKLIGVVFIGIVSVFLIPAGFDDAQITPIVGLLGTLAGYLIGS